MPTFKPGDKVLHKNAKDARDYGTVMDRPPSHFKPGMIAVCFQRQVWIKPESLVSLEQWKLRHSKPVQDLQDYWKQGEQS